MTQSPSPSIAAWGMLLALGLVWGASFLSVEIALTSLPPLSIVAARISTGALCVLTLAIWRSGRLPLPGRAPRLWLHALGMGIFSNALPFTLLAWGQQRVTSGFAGITMAMVPLMILPLAHVFVPGERMTARKVAGFATGFAGVAVLIGLPGAGGEAPRLAQAACIGATFCYATGAIITRRAPPAAALDFAAAALLCAAVLVVPLALIVEGWPDHVSGGARLGVAYLGIAATGLATLLLVTIIRSAGPSFLGLVNYQIPLWAVVIGAMVLGEPVPSSFAAALALILAGLALARPGRRA